MNIIQNPYYVHTPDKAEYVETRNEDGELVNYHAPVEGFFVIHHKPVPELLGMELDTSADNLISTTNWGAPTYTYKLDSQEQFDSLMGEL